MAEAVLLSERTLFCKRMRLKISTAGVQMWAAFVLFMLFGAAAYPESLLADSDLITNQWYEFSFTSAGVEALGCYPADMSPDALNCVPSAAGNSVFAPIPTWDFSIGSSAILTVTDAFLHGDSFDVYNDDELLFSTPDVAADGNGCGSDPVMCLADGASSHASFTLDPGEYSITIVPDAIGDAGAAYFEVAAPEPDLWPVLLLSGFALCTPAVRKRLQRSEKES
jgi:hypothetical protein